MTGLIALDIDGTVTAVRDHLPHEVTSYLRKLCANGWRLLFVTGRTFAWSYHLLEGLDFPYLLAVQNGALLFEMPARKILYKQYLSHQLLERIEAISKETRSGAVVYGGYEYGERCYYCPGSFSQEKLSYLSLRCHSFKEEWIALSDFSTLPLVEFASLRIFEDLEVAKQLGIQLETELEVHAPVMSDSFDNRFRILQITHSLVSKGNAVEQAIAQLQLKGPIIVAGDDHNDISMLKIADVAVVMATAPADVLQYADVIAPPAKELGIIDGLEEALKW